ncbi:MAG: helix-turn-helix transcriptional regulator [Bacteroidota bacterium]
MPNKEKMTPHKESFKDQAYWETYAYWEAYFEDNLYRALDSYMKKHGLNAKELARELDISRRTVVKILYGTANLSMKKVIQIGLKLGKYPVLEFKDMPERITPS